MHFKCDNCGGNLIFSPVKQKLVCPHCDGEDCGKLIPQKDMNTCPVCGAPVEPGEYGSALKCSSCDSWLILDERMEGELKPHKIIPFRLSKEQAAEQILGEFKNRPFIPKGFIDHKALMGIEGIYVPFWLYDYKSTEYYQGTGQKVRTWSKGDTQFTETSYFEVIREIRVDFDDIPADASERMDDELMDLIEPFDQKDLTVYAPEYISGFNSEIYNGPASQYAIRSRTKADKAIRQIVDDTIVGYSVVTPVRQQIDAVDAGTTYALYPVYRYTYRYQGSDYDIFVNGQTGKISGEAPTSKGLAFKYTAAAFVLGSLFMTFAASILSML